MTKVLGAAIDLDPTRNDLVVLLRQLLRIGKADVILVPLQVLPDAGIDLGIILFNKGDRIQELFSPSRIDLGFACRWPGDLLN